MDLSLFAYDLPPDRIAQAPVERRDESRLLVLRRTPATGEPALEPALEHRTFRDLPSLLSGGDLLVLNDTRVIPARVHGVRATGGRVEALLCRDLGGGRWRALLRAGGRLRQGERLAFGAGRGPGDDIAARLEADEGRGAWVLRFEPAGAVAALLEREGEMPLPPYIRRKDPAREVRELDRERYQTVYAREPGAVAAPTAGLHFTPGLLERLAEAGVERAQVTLHVGPGSFRPVETERVEEHRLDPEAYRVPPATAAALERARAGGGRVVACGTTVVRTLETYARTGEATGDTALYIYPPFEFRLVGALITNFHLPRSTLLMLVSAFAGRERVLAAYREAIARAYRFYSYGDAMLIL